MFLLCSYPITKSYNWKIRHPCDRVSSTQQIGAQRTNQNQEFYTNRYNYLNVYNILLYANYMYYNLIMLI